MPRRFDLVLFGGLTKLFFCLAALALGLLLRFSLPHEVAAAKSETELPVLMYHSVLKDPLRSGKYIVTPQTVEKDFAYLKQHGYESILPSELAERVTKGEPLPEKPVMITFDDGYLNNLTYVLPLLEEYDFKAVISIVGSYSKCFSDNPDHNPAYAHLCWNDIAELSESGRVEIGNHTYDMHKKEKRKGAKRMLGESEAQYYEALISDVGITQSLLEEYCGIVPTTFAYPYGYVCEESVPILKEMGFTVLLTCTEKVNMIGADPEALFSLGRFNRESSVTTERFMKKMGIH